MKILTDPLESISGGSLDLPSTENANISNYVDRPIIGYTQTLMGWELTYLDADPATYYDYSQYTAVCKIDPIYANI